MPDSRLILTASEVPLGATVYLVPPGSAEPFTDDGALRKLYGGVPMRAVMVIVDEMRSGPGFLNAQLMGLDDFVDGVRFSPVNVYTPGNAPADAKYAVFADGGRRMSTKPVRQPLKVAKTGNGTFYVANLFPFEPHGLAHNERFEADLEWDYGRKPEADLVALIYKMASWEVSGYERSRQVEALAQRHRGNPSELVALITAVAPEYLRQASLSQNAQLVRTDKIDAVPMERALAHVTA